MKNYLTSIFGLMAGIGLAVSQITDPAQAAYIPLAKLLAAVGAAGLGVCAKDFNVTGGTKEQ